GTAAGTAINDIATITSSTSDPNSANNTAIATDVVALATQADLLVSNIATPTSVAAGSNITYTQSVTNNGPAAATTVSFTQITPPNTTFQSITTPGGWTCTTPAIGATGTITCTVATLALNATAGFRLVLQVNAGTASGTNIADTGTATSSNIVPSITSNTATATVVVANANSATLAIVKTAMPSPTVPEGDTLTYTIGITNNGPSSATNVIVTDPLPSDLTFMSVTPSSECSNADGTVTCLLGTIANGGTATITILTLAGAPGVITNTASVVADQMTTPATSSQTETITAATSIKLESFAAQFGQDKTGANRVVLLWKTGTEVHNLGFNVYREQAGERVRLNSSLIAGSALLMEGALPKHSGRTYTWIDSSANAGSAPYWLEDVDVNGPRILHGPVSATASGSFQIASNTNATPSVMLNHLNQSQPAASVDGSSHRVENTSQNSSPTAAQQQKQFDLAAHSAIKIYVKHEGWYRVTQPELIAAGLSPNVDPAYLHLYAEAVEQPIEITGTTAGFRGFDPQAAIYFYGTGIDTQYSGTRVYFLVTEDSKGARIHAMPVSTGSNQPPASFPFTVELAPRTTYYSALTTANGYNFFGPLVSSTAVDETIQVPHLDSTSTESAKLDVILQGVILGVPHDVTVTLNGTSLGDVTFTGEAKGTLDLTLPPGVLQDGANTITLTSQNGEYDYSLLQSIRITYPHTYVADSNELTFTARSGDELKLTGFTDSAISVVDITDPNQPVQLTPQVTSDPSSKTYTAGIQVPWSTTNPSAPAQHTLRAVVSNTVASPAGIRQNHPSRWYSAQSGSEIVMVTSDDFSGALGPLKRAHEALGKSSALVLVDDLYDEFTFGQHSPAAIRAFLQNAVTAWHTAPHYLLLNGRASFDPRNYLGFGHLDFVPTQIIATTGLMTASDDWFSDFNNTGIPTIATGRLPVSTSAEAQLVAGKIASYEGQSTDGPWTSQALMVADTNDTENFTKDSQFAQAQLPPSMQVTDVFLTTTTVPDAQQTILTAINSGQLLVNYSGHGSEDEWSGENLFNGTEASTLTNGTSLPVFLIMDCLNGFFQDVYEEPLAVSLMLAPDGGAVAVLASSGLNQAPPQTTLDKLVVQAAMGTSRLPLGDAIIKAKSGISDLAVRKTYNLLGDPVMQIKPPVATHKR
ncbi:MAG: C25 family cysteine peptidase, partial [Candidatus Sulfotelmatobacter sp.]